MIPRICQFLCLLPGYQSRGSRALAKHRTWREDIVEVSNTRSRSLRIGTVGVKARDLGKVANEYTEVIGLLPMREDGLVLPMGNGTTKTVPGSCERIAPGWAPGIARQRREKRDSTGS